MSLSATETTVSRSDNTIPGRVTEYKYGNRWTHAGDPEESHFFKCTLIFRHSLHLVMLKVTLKFNDRSGHYDSKAWTLFEDQMTVITDDLQDQPDVASQLRHFVSVSPTMQEYRTASSKLLFQFLREHSIELQRIINEQAASILQQSAWAIAGYIPTDDERLSVFLRRMDTLYLRLSIPVIIHAARSAMTEFLSDLSDIDSPVYFSSFAEGVPLERVSVLLKNAVERIQLQGQLFTASCDMYLTYQELWHQDVQIHSSNRYPRQHYAS